MKSTTKKKDVEIIERNEDKPEDEKPFLDKSTDSDPSDKEKDE